MHVHVAEGPDDVGAAARLRPLATDDWLLVHCVHLADGERMYLDFAEAFHRALLSQGHQEVRSLEETLERAWKVASLLPRRELSMVSERALEAFYQGQHKEDASSHATG